MTSTVERTGDATTVDQLRRAHGVELIGELAGSGYRVPPSLVRRADGQTIQLTPLLYSTLREIDGDRDAAQVAAAVSESTGRSVNEDNVRHFITDRLRPLGLLVSADGAEPVLKKRNPLLGLRFRYAVSNPDQTRRLTDPFRFLFRPWVAVPVLAAFVVVCWWVFLEKGLASAAYDAFERPALLILVFAVTVVSAGFHEFGHAAAARYGGATPGVMGVGLYLVWPAFYTDVTDSYRLGRGGRIRTDLGGLYFNAIVAVAITGLWLWLRYDALLLVVATQIIQMLRQLAPLVRFDGYHVLADLTGVPDLYSRIKPMLLGVLPWRWGDPEARLLKPWARLVVTVWVLVVVPLLLASLALAVILLPRLMGTAWHSLTTQHAVLTSAWADGDPVQVTARVLAMIAIIIPVAGVVYLLIRMVRNTSAGAWRATAGKPLSRAAAVVLGGAVLCGVAYAWAPRDDNYRPIQAAERGTLGDIVYALGSERIPVADSSRPAAVVKPLVQGQRGVVQALWDTRTAPPTAGSPRLAVILVPRMPAAGATGGGGALSVAPSTDGGEGWVFPVDKPLAPGPGDNQALAVNTTDNTVVYDAAFALVYVEDSEALNVNEAHAYASCESCAAVAVAYQVVFVIDTDDTDDNVAIPQNLAGALNYDCVNCLTYAIAQQLFVTLDEPLSEDAVAELDAVWADIAAYQARIEAGEVPPDEIAAQLDEYTHQIKAIVEEDQPGTFPPESTVASTSAAPTSTATVAPSPTASSSAPEPSAAADPEPSTDPAAATDTEPTAAATATASPAPSAPANESTETGSTSSGTATQTDSTSGGSVADSTSDGSTANDSGSGGTTSGP